MIDSVRTSVGAILQKNNRGWITPERFNSFAWLAQLEIFESYFHDYNRWLALQNNKQSHSEFADMPGHIRQKIEQFLSVNTSASAITGSQFSMPSDFYRLMKVYYTASGGMAEEVDEVSNRRLVLLNRSNLTAPSLDYPVYVRSENTDATTKITVYPTTVTSSVTIDYIRKPAVPKWTYTDVAGNPVFNPSATDYQDFELHPGDEYKLVYRILSMSGLSIREQDVIQFAELKEQQSKQTETRQ